MSISSTTYKITSAGRRVGTYATLAEAHSAAETLWPGCVIGHDGDLSNGGDRTLIWPSEADARNDSGIRAHAQILEVQS